MVVNGSMWCVIKKMYEASRSAVRLEGERSGLPQAPPVLQRIAIVGDRL